MDLKHVAVNQTDVVCNDSVVEVVVNYIHYKVVKDKVSLQVNLDSLVEGVEIGCD